MWKGWLGLLVRRGRDKLITRRVSQGSGIELVDGEGGPPPFYIASCWALAARLSFCLSAFATAELSAARDFGRLAGSSATSAAAGRATARFAQIAVLIAASPPPPRLPPP